MLHLLENSSAPFSWDSVQDASGRGNRTSFVSAAAAVSVCAPQTLGSVLIRFSSCRGNSKYHYYGIRVKPDSPLNRLQEDMQYMALRQQPVQQKQR